jgi:hypothetical protein
MARVLHKTRSEWGHCIKLDVVGDQDKEVASMLLL